MDLPQGLGAQRPLGAAADARVAADDASGAREPADDAGGAREPADHARQPAGDAREPDRQDEYSRRA